MGYEDEIKINRHELDEEMIKQPQLYTTWALKAAEAEMAYEEAKTNYELIKGDFENRIRANPDRFDLPHDTRVTDKVAKITAEAQQPVKLADKKRQEAFKTMKILSKIEKGFQQRKNMLEALAYYSNRIYSSEPSENKVTSRLRRRRK